MKLRDLEYILTIAEMKSFVKAAEHCNVSQSTLSIQLKKVEEYLGVQIFERSNKNVMLTRVGEDICTCARIMLQESQKIKMISKKNKDPLAGDFYFGSYPTMGPYIFPKLISIFFAHFPKTKVYFIEEKAEVLADKLEEGIVDCALIGLPIEKKNMTSVELFWEPYYLAVPICHPLAKKKSIVMGILKMRPYCY